MLAQHSGPLREVDVSGIRLVRTGGTVSQPISLQISELDIFNEINRLYDDLLRNQIELDPDSKHALYANLWDLYT